MSGLADFGGLLSKTRPLPKLDDDEAIAQAATDQRRLRAQQQGRSSTFLGGSVGNPLRQKTLLGQ